CSSHGIADIDQRTEIPDAPRIVFSPALPPNISQEIVRPIAQRSALPSLCIHPINNFKVEEVPASGAAYAARITIPAANMIETGSAFQYYFDKGYVMFHGFTNLQGKELKISQTQMGGNLGNLILDQSIPSGDAIVVTAYSNLP